MPSILTVDDDRNICKVLKGLIEKNDFEALTANDVDSAMRIIEGHDLDLILTDLKMPGKSGMDLLELIKNRKPSIPVIMITAYGNIEAAVAAIKRGAYDFITKPFDEDELLDAIKKALGEAQKNKELVSAYFEKEGPSLPDIIGKTPSILQIIQTVKKKRQRTPLYSSLGRPGSARN